MMSDEEYLERTEINFFLKDLLNQLSVTKQQDEPFEFARSYFHQVRTGKHVIGTSYSFICESNYNRRAFVYYLVDAFKGFEDSSELTAMEFYHMIQTICPNFPKSIVLEAVLCVRALPSSITSPGATKYRIDKISTAVYFNILWSEWLRMMEDYFAAEATMGTLDRVKVLNKIKENVLAFPTSLSQPSSNSVISALSDASDQMLDGAMSLNLFRSILYASSTIAREIVNSVNTTVKT